MGSQYKWLMHKLLLPQVSSFTHSPIQGEIIIRVNRLIFLRYLAVLGVITVLFVSSYLPITVQYPQQIVLVFLLFFLNCCYHIIARQLKVKQDSINKWAKLANIQISLDFLVLTLQLHYSGGIENPFAAYYIFHTAFAGLLLSPLAAFFTAGWGSLLYITLIMGESFALIPHHSLNGWLAPSFYQHIWANIAAIVPLITAMIFMTYLMSSIGRDIGNKERYLIDLQEKLKTRSREIAKANRQLTHHSKEREQFLLTVEHELKSPLTAIQFMLDSLLLIGTESTQNSQDMIQRIQHRIKGLITLVQDLLSLSRLEQKGKKSEHHSVLISRIAWEEIETIRPVAEEKNLYLNTEIEKNLSISGSDDVVRYCLSNILSNAIRYTLKGGIKIILKKEMTQIHFIVEDSGIGIEGKELQNIFKDFYRTSSAKELVTEGTGVGMSLVKRSVEILNGSIHIDSQVNQGTKVLISFPAMNH